MPRLAEFPEFFRNYSWENKHALYGYPQDSFPNFEWIASLERRFNWLAENCESRETASIYLIREMIQWGGSQNGVLQKFDDGSGEVNLRDALLQVIHTLDTPGQAIANALQIPGMGLSYASKLLRFLCPDRYGALDSLIRAAIRERYTEIDGLNLPRIYDGNQTSMIAGYQAFLTTLETVRQRLEDAGIARPECALPHGEGSTHWRLADVEMALFAWAVAPALQNAA